MRYQNLYRHCHRYVVPLVFYHMLRRWTTVRPAVPHWPHRPLLDAEEEERKGSGKGAAGGSANGTAELQQVLIVDGIARSTEVRFSVHLSTPRLTDELIAVKYTNAFCTAEL